MEHLVGNTPSTVGVSAGDHVIDITMKGYKPWERKIKVTSGKIDIAAELRLRIKLKWNRSHNQGVTGMLPREIRIIGKNRGTLSAAVAN